MIPTQPIHSLLKKTIDIDNRRANFFYLMVSYHAGRVAEQGEAPTYNLPRDYLLPTNVNDVLPNTSRVTLIDLCMKSVHW